MINMETTSKLVDRFHALFGKHGGDVVPGNVGESRTVSDVCRKIIATKNPILFEYFTTWNCRPDIQPIHIMLALYERGQWEGAWALAQLHVDQVFKQEVKSGQRCHKGDPSCGLAILAREMGSDALVRHYGLLSSAGDLYWEHNVKSLRFGGLAPTLLEPYESANLHTEWRQSVRSIVHKRPNTPFHLEPFIAARWFAKEMCKAVYSLAQIERGDRRSFVAKLLDSVNRPGTTPYGVIGTRFEAAAGLLLSSTPGFEVRSSRQTTDEQTDLVVNYAPDRLSRLRLPLGPGLVECKSSKGPLTVSQLRDFGAKCLFHRVGFGILIARAGISGGGRPKFAEPTRAELVRRRFLLDGLTLLVLDFSMLHEKTHNLRGLQDELAADHDWLVFGPKSGERL